MSYDIVKEDVPRFIKRVGDSVIQGSNNTLLMLGTDRPGGVDSGHGSEKGAGSVYLVAGRKGADPDLKQDQAYLYLSMKTDVDANTGLQSVGPESSSASAAILKSDTVRVVFKKDIKISLDDGGSYVHIDSSGCTIKIGQSSLKISDGKVTVDAGKIELGPNAGQHVIIGESFKTLFTTHTHTAPPSGGTTSPPIQPWLDTTLFSQVTFLSR